MHPPYYAPDQMAHQEYYMWIHDLLQYETLTALFMGTLVLPGHIINRLGQNK